MSALLVTLQILISSTGDKKEALEIAMRMIAEDPNIKNSAKVEEIG